MQQIKPQRAHLGVNEIVLKDGDAWLHFANPLRLIAVTKPEDVLPALREIEGLVARNGWHAAGFLAYEAAAAFDPAMQTGVTSRHVTEDSGQEDEFPCLWFGLYPRPEAITLPTPEKAEEPLRWLPIVDRKTYYTSVQKIKDLIASGRTYQVNYTMRLQTHFTGDPWNFFLQLAQNQNKHAAYIDTGRYAICSASPELFFQLDGNLITCRPMKGTTRRGRTTLEDSERSEWLKGSVKDRAENVMIVDMVRNDLGRIAEIGSVEVPVLFETERYPTLWQLTSTVSAKTNASLTEIFTALFPCASITGAPKVSTMQIIAGLENTPRKIYTGSIGYITPRREAKFNVAIRTALIDRDHATAEYGIGGGVVWDSTGFDEYGEALLKARVLTEEPTSFSLLETMLWTPQEGFFLEDKHIARMLDSAYYFDIATTKDTLKEYFGEISANFYVPQRVRVLLHRDGRLAFQARAFESEANASALNACLAKEPVNTGNIFLYHKTTQRAVYKSATEGCEEFDDVLLYNETGQLTEFTIGNLVVELQGRLWTPPVCCGVLPGTFRAHLLERGQIFERAIPVELLEHCTKIYRINSVRKWQEVDLQTELKNA